MRRTWNRIGPWLTMLALAFLVFEGTAQAAKSKKPLVDLNTATQKELEELPGIGEATAKKIIAGRPYKSVADLAKAGVPEKTISKIEKQVTVSAGSPASAMTSSSPSSAPSSASSKMAAPAPPKSETQKVEKTSQAATAGAMRGGKVDLNTASQKELEDLPGIGAAYASKIIAGRPYSSVSDLSKAGIPASTVDKISPMVTVSKSGSKSKSSSASAASAEPPVGSPQNPVQNTAPSMAPGTGRSAAAPEGPPSRAPAGSVAKQPGQTSATMESGPPQQPPVKGMVWVNTETKVFHREGDRWYGATKHGKFMSEADAIKAGYRESKQKVSGQ